jgi:predicted nucleic acid-binding protein
VKVLFDTNVVLDLLLAREPHAGVAARLFTLVDNERIDGAVCATTVTTVAYVATKTVSGKEARKLLRRLLDLFAVAAVDRRVLEAALRLDFQDVEDAVIHEAARAWGAAGIVTRNGRDFARASLPVFDPAELLAAVTATGD